ncbi:MAG: hypothetical protein H6818_13715 [Phycisphaerales bacterium]|nr:hypothetical protein [Phycisphaerales bacterium]MCB9862141.1 hypothetical protein [Phycisphaerales bacterium]
MKSRNLRFCALATMALGLGLTGCFGDSILSAGAKIAGGQISQLTAGEIKILNETVAGVLASTNPGFTAEPLTDDQATALSNFFKANNLNSISDFEQLQQTAENNPDSLEGLDELSAAFNGGDAFDGENFDFDQIFNALFGALGGDGNVGSGGGTTTISNVE